MKPPIPMRPVLVPDGLWRTFHGLVESSGLDLCAVHTMPGRPPHHEVRARTHRRIEPGNGLTEREMQVLVGMARGLSNAAIGRELHLSLDTIKTHVKGLFRKLGVGDRAHAVYIACQRGLIGGEATTATDRHHPGTSASAAHTGSSRPTPSTT